MSNAIIAAVPATQTGEASSVNTIARTIGSSIGTAVISALLASKATAQGLPTDSAFTTAFWACAGVAVLAVAAALALPALHAKQTGRHGREQSAEPETPQEHPHVHPGGGHLTSTEEAFSAAGFPQTPLPGQRPAPTHSIRGVVHTDGSRPLPEAVITLADQVGRQIAHTTSGRDGSYQLSAPTAGTYLLITAATHLSPDATLIAVGDGPVTHDIALLGHAALTGRVRSRTLSETGLTSPFTGVSGARVTLTDVTGHVVAFASTDTEGSYSFGGLCGGDYVLTAQAGTQHPVARTVDVGDDGALAVDLDLPSEGMLSGTVTAGADGAVLADAVVVLHATDGRVVASAVTNREGSYRFGELPAGEYTITATSYTPVVHTTTVQDGAATRTDVHLASPTASSMPA